jgi:LmbE family N-acetylglucosaminyl deacetylase
MADRLPPLDEGWDRALAIVAHPDDLEYGAASAVARWTDQGKDVRYVLASRGEAGIADRPPTEVGPLRVDEQRASAAVVGVEVVEFLDHPDGTIVADLALRRDLARAIRRHRPEVVVSINFRDSWGEGGPWNHADHRAVGVATIDAARDAANRWVFPELLDEGLEPWGGVRFLAANASSRPTHAVDTTDTLDRGIESLLCHATYLAALDPGTPGHDPASFLRRAAAEAGPLLGVRYATTFEVVPV